MPTSFATTGTDPITRRDGGAQIQRQSEVAPRYLDPARRSLLSRLSFTPVADVVPVVIATSQIADWVTDRLLCWAEPLTAPR